MNSPINDDDELLTAAQEVSLAKQIEAGVLAQHLLDTDHGRRTHTCSTFTTRVTAEELTALVVAGRGAWQRMWASNLRLAWHLAGVYQRRVGGDPDELAQEAQLGLAEALQRWDYRRGTRFSTCAWWWINASIGAARRQGIRQRGELSRYGVVPDLCDPQAEEALASWVEALPSDWLLALDPEDQRVLHRRFGTRSDGRPVREVTLEAESTRRRRERAAIERARQAWQSDSLPQGSARLSVRAWRRDLADLTSGEWGGQAGTMAG